MGRQRRLDLGSLHRCRRHWRYSLLWLHNISGDCKSGWILEKHALDQRPISRGKHAIRSEGSVTYDSLPSLWSKPIGETQSKSLWTMPSRGRPRVPPCIGMVLISRTQSGRTASLVFRCAQYRLVVVSHTLSKRLPMVVRSTTRITLANMLMVFGVQL